MKEVLCDFLISHQILVKGLKKKKKNFLDRSRDQGFCYRRYRQTRSKVFPPRVFLSRDSHPSKPFFRRPPIQTLIKSNCISVTTTMSILMIDWTLFASIPCCLSHRGRGSDSAPGKCNMRSFVDTPPSCRTEPLNRNNATGRLWMVGGAGWIRRVKVDGLNWPEHNTDSVLLPSSSPSLSSLLPASASLIQCSRQDEGPRFCRPARSPRHCCTRLSPSLSSLLRRQGLPHCPPAVVEIGTCPRWPLDQPENWPEAESLRRAREASLRRYQSLQASSVQTMLIESPTSVHSVAPSLRTTLDPRRSERAGQALRRCSRASTWLAPRQWYRHRQIELFICQGLDQCQSSRRRHWTIAGHPVLHLQARGWNPARPRTLMVPASSSAQAHRHHPADEFLLPPPGSSKQPEDNQAHSWTRRTGNEERGIRGAWQGADRHSSLQWRRRYPDLSPHPLRNPQLYPTSTWQEPSGADQLARRDKQSLGRVHFPATVPSRCSWPSLYIQHWADQRRRQSTDPG